MRKDLVKENIASSCYFRSSVIAPHRKALLQITERCNLHCSHCFLSAGDYGRTMSFDVIQDTVIPRLQSCRVIGVTLTGGEPFIHPDIIRIARLFKSNSIRVGICSNGSAITTEQIKSLVEIGDIHVNVSLDGFTPASHGKFRGDEDSFDKTIDGIRRLGKHHLLRGILVTPNNFAEANEYVDICEFAIENGASYVLINPLASMGRGTKSKDKLGSPDIMMRKIQELTSPFSDRIQIVYVRFPNDRKFPLGGCEAGSIIYVFTSGNVVICPYLVFASRTPQSRHKEEEFIIGNIFSDADINDKVDTYRFHEKYHTGNNPICSSCSINLQCGKGCPAAVIASGGIIGTVDEDICPIETTKEDKVEEGKSNV